MPLFPVLDVHQVGACIAVFCSPGWNGITDLSLYDLTGRLLRRLVREGGEAYSSGLLFPDIAKGFSNGNYLIRLRTADGSLTRRLIVNR